MKIIPDIKTLSVNPLSIKDLNYVTVNINENFKINYICTKNSDNDILQDLVECNGFATALLFLNENYELDISNNDFITESTVADYYNDCNDLLFTNTTIVEEVGIPLASIGNYKIFEGNGYILRGNGKKKVKETFKVIEEDSGVQVDDIAPKVDQELGSKKSSKKKKANNKYFDVLLSEMNENLSIINKGFFKNSNGQYQRGNYILIKEGEKYTAINKNKLK